MEMIAIFVIITIMCLGFVAGAAKNKPSSTEANRDKPSSTNIEKGTRSVQGCDEVKLEVKVSGTFKSYMDGSCITDETSEAYKQIQKMIPDENGIYSENFYKGIAMAGYYGRVGDKFKIETSEGKIFFAVMTDIKAPEDVDENHSCKINGSLIEFVVDEDLLSYETKLTGSLETVYPGQIISIEKIEEA